MISLSDKNLFDPWLDASASPTAGARDATPAGLQISTIESIEPLDAQLGAAVKKTVPDALRDALFGQPEPSPAEIEAAGGDPAAVPPMRTYAILDAAKAVNLPEMLEDSDLEHLCLFKGKAYDDLKNVAPWIVQLEDGNTFTRNLFTRSDACWHLWDNEPGIYVRSRAPLDEMWRHFRTFTRVQDESGRWNYLRFWEPSHMDAYLEAIYHDRARVGRWLCTRTGNAISFVIIAGLYRQRGESRPARWFSLQSFPGMQSNQPFMIRQFERDVFARTRRADFVMRLDKYLSRAVPEFSAIDPPTRDRRIQREIEVASAHGIRREKAVADFTLASLLHPYGFANDPRAHRILAADTHPLDKGKHILDHVRSLKSP